MRKKELESHGEKQGLSKHDIEAIILHNSGLTKEQLFMVDTIDNSDKIMKGFHRISEGVPIQYVVNSSEFYGRNFYVDKHVLIPRIDTELMIDLVLAADYPKETTFIDVGTGSGIIILSLAHELEGYEKLLGVDYSIEALEVAKKNRSNHGLQDDVVFLESDLLIALPEVFFENTKKIVIAANLPYIKNNDHENMSDSTVNFEPDLALYGGKTGFELYEILIGQCLQLGKKGADIDLYIEIGFDQKNIAMNFLTEKQLDFEFFKDSATIERVVYIHGF